MNKTITWIIVAVVVIGGLIWLIGRDDADIKTGTENAAAADLYDENGNQSSSSVLEGTGGTDESNSGEFPMGEGK